MFSMVAARSPSDSSRASTRSTSAQSGKSSFNVDNCEAYRFFSSPSSPWSADVSRADSPFICLDERGPREEPWAPLPPRAVLLPRAGRDCTSDMWNVCLCITPRRTGWFGGCVGVWGDDVVRRRESEQLKEQQTPWHARGRGTSKRGAGGASCARSRVCGRRKGGSGEEKVVRTEWTAEAPWGVRRSRGDGELSVQACTAAGRLGRLSAVGT